MVGLIIMIPQGIMTLIYCQVTSIYLVSHSWCQFTDGGQHINGMIDPPRCGGPNNYDTSRYHDINILPGHVYLLGEPFVVPVYRRGPAYYGMIDPPRWAIIMIPQGIMKLIYCQVTSIYLVSHSWCQFTNGGQHIMA